VFLENRLIQVKRDLESAEDTFSAFASRNMAIDVPAQGKAMIEAAASVEGELIASRTQLESLKQIYADNNVRVRATQARVEELRRQVDKQLGSASEPLAATGQADQPVYPSIRTLPLLGVSYADLYRNSRLQEAIFETLTRQYELARVEEAKETPTIKVLDAPEVPDGKSFPPRFWIALSGTLIFVAIGVAAILARARWLEIDQHSPSRLLAIEIFETTRAYLPFVPADMAGPHGNGWGRQSPRSGDINPDNNGRTHWRE
jgi:capsule polysaccharide export protein KpsE/RkpR